MFKKIAVSLVVTVLATTAAQAGGFNNNRSSSLLGALVTLGNHGNIANIAADVGQTSRGYHGSSSLADVNANLLGGAVRADVGVAQSGRRGSSLLDLHVHLGGGVGNRPGRW